MNRSVHDAKTVRLVSPSSLIKNQRVRIRFDFSSGGDPKKLSLRQGDLVVFLGLSEKGWAKGTDAQGKSGFFPAGFCLALGSEEEEELIRMIAENDGGKQSKNKREDKLEDVVRLAETIEMQEKIANATKQQMLAAKEISPPPSAPPSPPPGPAPKIDIESSSPSNADPLAGVMKELESKKGWKIGATRKASAAVPSMRINSLEMRIKQLEQENKELLAKLGRCKLCDVELVCVACEARRNKPLPRESMYPDEDQLLEQQRRKPLPRESMFPDVEEHPKKPLPLPRDSEAVSASRESTWFFQDK